MDRTNFMKGQLKYLILKALGNSPLHGYAIGKRINELTNNLWKPTSGALYPALKDLKKSGKIEIIEKEVGGRKKKVYKVTKSGKELLKSLCIKTDAMEEAFLDYYKGFKDTKETSFEAFANSFSLLHKIAFKSLAPYRGELMKFIILLKENKISPKNKKKFISTLENFFKEVKKITTESDIQKQEK